MEVTATKATFPKYPAYKDTGVEWLGVVPSKWEVLPLFALTKLKSISNCPDLELLSVYLDLGVIRFSDIDAKRTNATSLDLSKYQKVEPGDFVLNNQQAWRGSVGVSNYEGIVSPAYIILSLSHKLNPSFANYYFRNGAMVSQYLISSKGVGTIQRNLYWPQLRRTYVGIPPIDEQTAIANFLDEKTAKIDRAIAQKEQLIALLKERKQIIIQNAVTKGLDPNVKLKDSGVEWIGEIPEDWEVCSVKYTLEIPITDGPHTTPELLDEGYPFISAEAVKNGKIDFSKKRGFISEKDHRIFCQKYKPQKGDIYMVKSGATTGNIAMVETDEEFSIWSPLAVFRINDEVLSNYYLYNFLESYSFKKGVELKWSFGTQQNIGMGVLSNLPIAFGSIQEQLQIVNYIKESSSKVEQAISLQKTQIEKLKEYKTTLIDSAVTGKIKVPGV